MLAFAAFVTSTLVLLQFDVKPVCAAAATELKSNQGDEHRRLIVPLNRQRVPVAGEGGTLTYKSIYYGTIFLGQPYPQEFSVVFDTGSAYIIVPSTMCKTKTCMVHRRYHKIMSETSLDVDYDGTPVQRGQPRDQISLTFGTGEIVGQFADDWLCLSNRVLNDSAEDHHPNPANQDAHLSKIEAEVDVQGNSLLQQKPQSIPNKTVIEDEDRFDNTVWGPPIADDCMTVRVVMATKMSEEPFRSFSFDGVLGLGLDSLALVPQFNFFSQMIQQGMVSEPTFGIFLAEAEDDFSEISFGGHNPRRVQSNLTHVPVVQPKLGYWMVRITGIRVGDKRLDFCDDGSCGAVVDSGTSLLAVPKAFAGTLQEELMGNIEDPANWEEGLAEGCKEATGPEIYFELDGYVLVLTAGDYTRQSHSMEDYLQGRAAEKKQATNATNASDASKDSVMLQADVDYESHLGFGLSASGGKIATRETFLIQQVEDIGFATTASETLLIQQDEQGKNQASEHQPDDDNRTAEGMYGPSINATHNATEDISLQAIDNWRMEQNNCRPALMAIEFPEPLGPKLFILGEPLLRKYYTEYNFKQKTVGFGLAYHPSQTSRSEVTV